MNNIQNNIEQNIWDKVGNGVWNNVWGNICDNIRLKWGNIKRHSTPFYSFNYLNPSNKTLNLIQSQIKKQIYE